MIERRRLIGYRVRGISADTRGIASPVRDRGVIVSWDWEWCKPLPKKDARRLFEIVRKWSEFRDGVRLFRVYRRRRIAK